jgi:hypothetical protein
MGIEHHSQSTAPGQDGKVNLAQIFIRNIPLMGEMMKVHMKLNEKRANHIKEIERAVLAKPKLKVCPKSKQFSSNNCLAQEEADPHIKEASRSCQGRLQASRVSKGQTTRYGPWEGDIFSRIGVIDS